MMDKGGDDSAAAPAALNLGRVLVFAVVFAVACLSLLRHGTYNQLNAVFYDTMIGLHERPANDELIIVAIDEKSLGSLGALPWPRRVHASMVDKLSSSDASAVGFDIPMSPPGTNNPGDDGTLAAAIERNGRVVLAPANFTLDPDGLLRRVNQQSMGYALIKIAHPELARSPMSGPGKKAADTGGPDSEAATLIAYSGPPGHILTVSYVDVLEGRVPRGMLQDRIVMIGATAAGSGKNLSTPVSNERDSMPGIEVSANIVAAVLDGRQIHDSGIVMQLIASVVLASLLLLWLLAGPRHLALAGYLGATGITFLTSAAVLLLLQLWIPPTLPLLLLTALYGAWSFLDIASVNRLSNTLRTRIQSVARHDKVTGLPNQAELEGRLEEILSAGETPGNFSLLLLSMGRNSSAINLLGTRGNNQLHRQISDRLTRALPETDTVYCLDDAEFAVLIDGSQDQQPTEIIAARLVQSLLRPFRLDRERFSISPSIGASQYPFDGREAKELIDNAQSAMLQARRDKISSFCMFSKQIKTDVSKQSRINRDLKYSIGRDELTCLFQPLIAVASGHLVGVEALVRWKHPKFGNIPPTNFIPVAEREGLIGPIGEWVLNRACMQGRAWMETYGRNLRIAVNLSAVQLNSTNLPDTVRRILTQSGLPASSLELELTETTLLSNQEANERILMELKTLGLSLAIDDFGTGYSCVSNLKNFPIDRIKIDRSFISDVHRSDESAEITRAIVTSTQEHGLAVTAKGIERPEQLHYLQQLGCEEAQGFMLGIPMTDAKIEASIASGQLALAPKPAHRNKVA